MDYFPAFVDLRGKSCLVVGGGGTATRKVRLLKRAGADVLVVAPKLSEELNQRFSRGEVRWFLGGFDSEQLTGQRLVIAATDSPGVNRTVFEQAERRGIWANSVDDPVHSSFITPAIVDRSPITVAISSAGTAPVLARQLRERIEQLLPQRLGALAQLAAGWRNRVKQAFSSVAERRRFWEHFFNGPAADRALAGQSGAAEAAAQRLLGQQPSSDRGRVAIVGAGPGDPGLLTLRALQLMQSSDVVLYDRLVSPEVLDLSRRDAELISVGKAPGAPTVDQDQIHRLLIQYAGRGRRVVRLKGGDPLIFGRGGEEAQALQRAGIDFEFVPGISAGPACAAYAGIPLTHREYSHSVQFITAHCKKLLECVDWTTVGKQGQTLVFYMAVKNLPLIQRGLLDRGLAPHTPIALVENGTSSQQRVVTGTLRELTRTARSNLIKPPSVLIVGEVVAARQSWFEPAALPLAS